MKEGSDNFRSSAVQGIMKRIVTSGINIIVYEPELDTINFCGAKVISDLDDFKNRCDVIVANRRAECLKDVAFKCFSRDLFGDN